MADAKREEDEEGGSGCLMNKEMMNHGNGRRIMEHRLRGVELTSRAATHATAALMFEGVGSKRK